MPSDPALTIRPGDLATAVTLMREAAQWLADRGEPLWRSEDLTVEVMKQRCTPSEVFIGYLNDEPAVTALLQSEDRVYWPGIDDAFFLHKLTVRRAFAGKGLAVQMLDWAVARAHEQGKRFVRLDTAADRPKLCAFYEKNGFRRVGLKTVGTMTMQLYRRAAASPPQQK